MRSLLHDFRLALRQLRKSPGFAAVCILTIALGIGANTAIFSVMNAVLLRYLPVRDPQQLYYFTVDNRPELTNQTGYGDSSLNLPSYEALRKQKQVLSDAIALVPLAGDKVAIRYSSEPEEAMGEMVSGNFFSALGVSMARGTAFTEQDETQHSQVVVLSYDFWTSRFARSSSVIGQTLFIKGVPFTIIGVAAPKFAGADPQRANDFWIPLQNSPIITAWGQPVAPDQSLYGAPNWWCVLVIGRLQPFITPKQAIAQLTPVLKRSAYEAIPKPSPDDKPMTIGLEPVRGVMELRDAYQEPVKVLMGMVVLVLIIACGNVAMLMVARNSNRQHEFGVRIALGASRLQLFRQLLTESLVLVATGAILGWLFAMWATSALSAWSRVEVSIAPDTTVLLFTFALSALVAVILGIAPLSSAANVSMQAALKTSAATSRQDRHTIAGRKLVVAAQMSLCLVLLIGAGLLFRTLRNLKSHDLGLRTSGLLVFGLDPQHQLVFGVQPQDPKQSDAKAVRFYQSLLDRIRVLPGVESATLLQNRLGMGWSNNTWPNVDGQKIRGNFRQLGLRWNAVGGDFFHVLGTPILLGRDLSDADTADASKVVVVNETFVKRLLPNTNPIGHHISIDDDPKAPQYTIVGVVRDSRYTSIRESDWNMAYFPYAQLPGIGQMQVELRTLGDPNALLPDVRRIVHDLDPNAPLQRPTTQQAQFEQSISRELLISRLASFFGALAALLVALGLYGTLAYNVNRRTTEIGVRMALGAQRGQVVWLVLRESLILAAVGLVVGLPLAFAGTSFMRSILFGLGKIDVITYVAAFVGIGLVTMLASYIPARRAASIDPMQALRSE